MKNKIHLLRIRKRCIMLKNWIILITFYLIVFNPLTSESQVTTLPENATFYDYLDSFYNSERYNPEDETEGGQKVSHERLSQIWGKRLYPHGDFSIANRAIIDYAQSFIPVDNRTEDPNWICIGPSDDPVNSSSNGVGQIHRITFDPGYGNSNQTIYACTGFGGLWRTENDGMLWEVVNTDALPIASVADVVINPNNNQEIIIATGVADGGVELAYSPNWGSTNPIFTIGMYRSTNYGASWHEINDGFIQEFYNNGGTVRKLEINQNDPNIVFAATSNGVFRTENAFDTDPVWEKVFSGPVGNDMDFRSVKFKPGSSNTIYASGRDIFNSTDGGDTWTSMTGPNTGLDFADLLPFEPYRINIAVTPANVNRMFAYIWGPNPGSDNSEIYIYYCDNGSWNQLYNTIGYGAKEWIALAVSTKNADEYYFYWIGVKGRENLVDPPIPHASYIGNGYYADGHVLEYPPYHPPTDPLIYYGHHAGFSVGDLNGTGSSWEFRNTGLQNMLHWSFDDSEFEGDIILTANQDCFHYYKKDDEWRIIPGVIGDSYSARSSGVNKDLYFLSRGDNVLWSYDMSTEQKFLESSIRPYDGYVPNNLCHIPKTYSLKTFPNDNSDYFSFSEIYKRIYDWPAGHNSNDLWEIDSDIGKVEPLRWKRQITELDFCYSQPDHIYLATGGGYTADGGGIPLDPLLFKTTIGGNNGDYNGVNGYTQLSYPGMGGSDYPLISGIAVHPTDPNRIWLSLIGYDNITIRIAYSSDGGMTWENADPNNSLPKLPVNNIVYQYGSNDVLYLATDAGIYYKDASMQNWEEYGEFPHVRVMELDINYCQNKLRAATYGRSVWEGDLQPAVSEVYYTISSGESIIWDKSMSLSTGLIIESGAELTIKGIINVPKDNKIIVKQGGRLIVDGGTIRNGCGHSWQGIQVWGDESASQYTEGAQGILILDHATIENAITAVELWKPGDYSSTGGMIEARSSIFKNNAKAIHALNYRNFNPVTQEEMDYYGTFSDCSFIVDDEYLGDYTFYKHIDLDRVRGLKFYGCDFSLDHEASNVSQWNHAIAAYNAGFNVLPVCLNSTIPCEAYDSCRFKGFDRAIGSFSTPEIAYPVLINRARFDDNSTGIYFSSTDYCVVINNFLEVGYDAPYIGNCGFANGVGIDIQTSNGFAVENNKLRKNDHAATGTYAGIRVASCPSEHDIIYKNELIGLSYGNYAQGTNRSAAGQDGTGVEYQCNYNALNAVDFIVTDTNYSNAKVRGWHGSRDAASGNVFSSYTPTVWHFRNEGLSAINWYYCDQCTNEEPLNIFTWRPEYFEKIISDEFNCPDNHGGGGHFRLTEGERTDKEVAYIQNLNDFNSVKYLYESMIDDGNTSSVLFDVQLAEPEDMWALRSQLLGSSPHLSQEVLRAVAERTDVFPDGILLEILSANPDELNRDTLISFLEQKENPLPQYMIEILQQAVEGVTYKTILLDEMARYHATKTQAAQDLIRDILFDTVFDPVEYRDWLGNMNNLVADRQIIGSYLSEKDTVSAMTLLNLLPSLYGLEGVSLEDYNNYKALVEMQVSWITQGKMTHEPDSLEIPVLLEIAENGSAYAGNLARNILEYANVQHYCNCLLLPDSAYLKHAAAPMPKLTAENKSLSISARPNPGRTYIVFDYQLPDDMATGNITFSDVTGRTIYQIPVTGKSGQKVWNTTGIIAGIYYYTLKSSGMVKSGKILIY